MAFPPVEFPAPRIFVAHCFRRATQNACAGDSLRDCHMWLGILHIGPRVQRGGRAFTLPG